MTVATYPASTGFPNGQSYTGPNSADGGVLTDRPLPLSSLEFLPGITNSTGGTASTTFAAIVAGATYLQADMVAVKNALAQIAIELNALSYPTTATGTSTVQFAAAASSAGSIQFQIPREYDETSDTFLVRIVAYLQNTADNGITLSINPNLVVFNNQNSAFNAATSVTGYSTQNAGYQGVSVANGTASPSGTDAYGNTTLNTYFFGLPGSTAMTNNTGTALTTTPQVLEANLSKLGLSRDTIVSMPIAIAGTTSGILFVEAIEVHYASTIVSYRVTDFLPDDTRPAGGNIPANLSSGATNPPAGIGQGLALR